MRNSLLSARLVRTVLALVVALPPVLSVACSSGSGGPSPSVTGPVEGADPPAPTAGGGTGLGSSTGDSTSSSTASAPPSSGSGTGSSSTTTIVDSGAAAPDSGTASTADATAPQAGFAGTYECTLSGMAQVSILGGAPQPENLPLNAQMTVTETGTAISAVIMGDAGANCTVLFTDQGSGTADINASQSCMLPITMPIMTTADISFVSTAGNDAGPPGTASLSGTTINVDLPFDVTVAGGLAKGTGVLTGACTGM
jgi:hypothetical protein